MEETNLGDSRLFHDHCPKHGGRSSSTDDVFIGSTGIGGGGGERLMMKETSSTLGLAVGSGAGVENTSHAIPSSVTTAAINAIGSGNGTEGQTVPCGNSGGSGSKKQDPKEIMKKRRERAICIDRVSRVIFPSTFILLNIIYWLVFSEILEAIQTTTGIGVGSGSKEH